MKIVDKIMSALSLYDEEEILDEELEQASAKEEPEKAKERKGLFAKKDFTASDEEPKKEKSSLFSFKARAGEKAAQQEETPAEKPKQMSGKTIELPIADKLMTVVVLEPVDFNDSQNVADYLRDNQPVVINFAATENIVAKRMTDFISGTVYALGGSMKKIGRNILICAPMNVDIDAEADREESTERGNNPWEK